MFASGLYIFKVKWPSTQVHKEEQKQEMCQQGSQKAIKGLLILMLSSQGSRKKTLVWFHEEQSMVKGVIKCFWFQRNQKKELADQFLCKEHWWSCKGSDIKRKNLIGQSCQGHSMDRDKEV